MRIAVDAMGGDSPEMVVQGALEAAIAWDIDLTLVGDERILRDLVEKLDPSFRCRIVHCREMVAMNEPPVGAVRRKKDASIRVAFNLVKQGAADAVVSAGNSGATLAAGMLVLGKLKMIERPAFAGILPGEKGDVIMIDVGANVDCRPEHLFQFGVMAQSFAVSCLGMENPKIGLLNIGQEGGKGNEQVRQAHDLFKASHLHFVGNVEGRTIFSGEVEIIVCDGFVGNVALKLSEGLSESFIRVVQRTILGKKVDLMHALEHRDLIQEIVRKLDYAEYGGAPILGINGVGIVSHGSSSDTAIKNAVRMADHYAKQQMPERLGRYLSSIQDPLRGSVN